MTEPRRERAPFATTTPRGAKAMAGSTDTSRTPLAIRTAGVNIGDALRERTRSRLGAKLGKHAGRIERVSVRFEDQNGPRGGIDTTCRIKVVLSGFDSVVFEAEGREPGEALDLAIAGVERAVRSTLGRAGTRAKKPRRASAKQRSPRDAVSSNGSGKPPAEGSLIGRRVGQARKNLDAALDRPEKRRRDQPVDTSQPGVSASDRRAGGPSTARRNTKGNTARATAALEDSLQDRPSRKSTRKSANRSKRDSNLKRRQVRRLNSPQARAARSNARRV